jgi:hypothetical protein
MFGYFFWGLALLFYIGLALLDVLKPLSGQNNMGYELTAVFFWLGFTISSLVLTFCVAGKGGFDWVLTAGVTRNFLLGIGWVSVGITTFFCTAFQGELHKGELPFVLRLLPASHGQIWIPLLMLVPYFFLLNVETRANVSSNVYKTPLILCFALCFSYLTGLCFMLLRDAAQGQIAKTERMTKQNENLHDEHLSFIAAQKTTDGVLSIIALTGRFHDADVRLAAVAKIKSFPDWEDKLIELLNNDYYHSQVYTFMDGNKVEHPEKFLQPLNQRILWMANDIRKQIKAGNNLQDWHFDALGIECLLYAIDEQFANKGMDFRPAVLTLQEALQTSSPKQPKNVRFTVTPIVNHWLKKH